MVIAPQCQPGSWRNPNNWIPLCAWPEGTYIQWGSPNGDTFFECFPPVNGDNTIIHTKGKSLEEAEAKAFSAYQRFVSCEHTFERRNYTSGAGICSKCGMFQTEVFDPIEYCCQCNNPKGYGHDNKGRWWCEECFKTMPEELWTDMQREMRELEKEPPLSDEEFDVALTDVFKHLSGKD